MRTFTLTEATLSEVLGYLGKRPHNEVAQLVLKVHNELAPQVAQAEAATPTATPATTTEAKTTKKAAKVTS